MKRLALLLALVACLCAFGASNATALTNPPVKTSCPAGDQCTYTFDTDLYLWFNGSGRPSWWASSYDYWRYAVLTSYNGTAGNSATVYAYFLCGNEANYLFAGSSVLIYNRCGYSRLFLAYQGGTTGRLAHFHVTLYR